jgi:hypothetical protein
MQTGCRSDPGRVHPPAPVSQWCCAVCDIASTCEQSGRTTGRLGYIWPRHRMDDTAGHSGTESSPQPPPDRIAVRDHYGPGGAVGGWTSPPSLQGPHNSFGSTAGRMEQRADVGRSDSASSGRHDHATTRERAGASVRCTGLGVNTLCAANRAARRAGTIQSQ